VGRRSAVALSCAALFAAIGLAYANHFDNAFQFDDSHVIEENAAIRDPANIPRFFRDPATGSALPTNRDYRPLLTATFAVDYWLAGGLDPRAFHRTGLAIHLAVVGLLALLAARVLDVTAPHPANAFVAILAAGWFGLHTANAETVNYVSARSDSLSTAGVLAAFAIWTSARGRWRQLACLPLAAAMLVKSSALMAAPLLLFYELLFSEGVGLRGALARRNRPALGRALRRVAPAAIVAAGCFALILAMTPDTFDPGGRSPWGYWIAQPFVLLRYSWTFLLPVGLSADTDWTVLESAADWRFAAGMAFVAGALALAFAASERRATRPIAFGLLWFFAALLPTSVLPLAEVTNDHRMYFPFAGLALAAAWALALLALRHEAALPRAPGARALAALAFAALLAAHAFGVWRRNEVWDTRETLWLDVTRQSPRNGRGLMNYGLTQMAAGRFDVALEYFERARATSYAEHPYLFVNLALAKQGLGHDEEVEAWYLGALQRGTSFPATRYYYAKWLAEQGRLAEASGLVDEALRLSPGYEQARALRAELDERLRAVDAGERVSAGGAGGPAAPR
jgi:tetratricopeptide (TPR) repeat protein